MFLFIWRFLKRNAKYYTIKPSLVKTDLNNKLDCSLSFDNYLMGVKKKGLLDYVCPWIFCMLHQGSIFHVSQHNLRGNKQIIIH
jgi:hypothetical protein